MGPPCQELTGSLKLKTFELERAGFTMDEVSRGRQRLETENTRHGGFLGAGKTPGWGFRW